jgi:uroporphyrinogen decarboxylase
MEAITQTFEKYAVEIRNAGADGLFYATLEWASEDLIRYEQYAGWCRPLDLRIIKAAGNDALNILHVCAGNNFLKELSDYPVQFVNWEDANPTNINLDDSYKFLGEKVAIAGLDHKGWLWHAGPEEIATEVNKIKSRMKNRRFIFGPGCAVEPEISYANQKAVRDNL